MRPITASILAAAMATMAACAVPSEPTTSEPSETREAPELDKRSSDFVYLRVTRRDMRKCMAPMCGGWFVAAVNQAQTTCFDGQLADDCYVSEIDWSAIGLDPVTEADAPSLAEQGKVLLRGAVGPHSQDFPQIPKLVLDAAWAGQTLNEPQGAWYQVVDSGIVCITYPCPVMQAVTLNLGETAMMAGIDLQALGASQDVVDEAGQRMQSQGLMVAATATSVTGPGGTLAGLEATEIYLPLGADAVGEPCGSNLCGAGEYCCNASCSLCVPDGNMCTQQACEPLACGHDECVSGEALEAGCSSCATTVCAVDPYCCDSAWDGICVNEAQQMCDECAPPEPSCAHSTCAQGGKLEGSCSPCATTVCAADPFCCATAWDDICVDEATELCAECAPPPPSCAHDACEVGAKLQADCSDCVSDVCAADAFCCDVTWDSICAQEASAACGCS